MWLARLISKFGIGCRIAVIGRASILSKSSCSVGSSLAEPHQYDIKGRDNSRTRSPAVGFACRDRCYFRSSTCPVNEPSTRRILPRSTAPWLAAATEPDTAVAIASPLAVAPSNAAQFL